MSVGFAQYTMDDKIYDYIDEYKDLAMREMELYGIPASITLAQAIYSSQAGTNDLVRECHNHFAIMCHTQEWKGETYYRPSDKKQESCYRKYASDEESYRDHSLFLSTRSRYVKLFYFPITDYKSWANGLLEAGFSRNPKYADTLISIIEKYYLMHYDRKVAQKLGDTVALRAMKKPQPERVTDDNQSVTAQTTTPKPTQVAEPEKKVEPQPVAETKAEPKPEKKSEPKSEPQPEPKQEAKQEPKQEPKQEVKQETAKKTAKSDTMEVNGIQVIVEKNKEKSKPVEKPAEQPKSKQDAQPAQPSSSAPEVTNQPEKVNGLNVFVLDPYAIPYKSAYYPYTSRPVYENNKTKFILARPGDTYQKLAAALQLTEKNLRLYNDVYDGSEPIEDEVIYLEMKSTKSTVPYHTLQEGDTYRYIAQRYGIQLKILIKRNSGNINSYGVGDKICIGCN